MDGRSYLFGGMGPLDCDLSSPERDWLCNSDEDILQDPLSETLLEAMSLLEWAPEGESQALIGALEAFVKRAKFLRGDGAGVSGDGDALLKGSTIESEAPQSTEPVPEPFPALVRGGVAGPLPNAVQAKSTRASATVAAIEWDFQEVCGGGASW